VERRALQTAALALLAALAFALGAAAFAETVPAGGASDEATAPEEPPPAEEQSRTDSSVDTPSGGIGGACGVCSRLDIRTAVLGALPPGTRWLVLGTLVVGLAALATAGLRRGEREAVTAANATTGADRAAGGGAAATAIGGPSETRPTNDVYAAWARVADAAALDDPATVTPRTTAQAAVDAGLPSTRVRELRRLFERVRYGGATPTADRERRASALAEGLFSAVESNATSAQAEESSERTDASASERVSDP